MGFGFHTYSRVPGVFIWLWVFALVAQVSAVAPVLCMRTDGRVEVEAACTCHDDRVSHGVASSSSSNSVSKPGNVNHRSICCFDPQSPISTGAPIGADRDSTPDVKSLRSEAFAVSTTISADVVVGISSEAFALNRPPPDKTSLVSLRTIVLLC